MLQTRENPAENENWSNQYLNKGIIFTSFSPAGQINYAQNRNEAYVSNHLYTKDVNKL